MTCIPAAVIAHVYNFSEDKTVQHEKDDRRMFNGWHREDVAVYFSILFRIPDPASQETVAASFVTDNPGLVAIRPDEAVCSPLLSTTQPQPTDSGGYA